MEITVLLNPPPNQLRWITFLETKLLIISSHIQFYPQNNAWQHFRNLLHMNFVRGDAVINLFIALQDGASGQILALLNVPSPVKEHCTLAAQLIAIQETNCFRQAKQCN